MFKRNLAFATAALITATSVVAVAAQSGQYGEASFNATLTLYAPIVVTKLHDLTFGEIVSGTASDNTIAPGSANAAQFSATGDVNADVTGAVQSSSITLTNGVSGPTGQITVDTFTYGGDLSSGGAGSFDSSGDISDMRVGATAHVASNDTPGAYTGSATFRVTYV